MNIVLITQDDPFYLARNLDSLFEKLPEYVEVKLCILTHVSPFGKKKNFFGKILETISIFGPLFFIRYSIKYLKSKLDKNNQVTKVLMKHQIPLFELSSNINNKSVLDKIRSHKPDLIISIAGNQIFKSDLINIPTSGIINLHTADLPKYRGLFPTFWALKNNESKIGVSIFFVDEGIDSGPIIVKRMVDVRERNLETLIVETKRIGMECILEAINYVHEGDYKLIENSDDDSSYFSFPRRADVIEFKKSGNRL